MGRTRPSAIFTSRMPVENRGRRGIQVAMSRKARAGIKGGDMNRIDTDHQSRPGHPGPFDESLRGPQTTGFRPTASSTVGVNIMDVGSEFRSWMKVQNSSAWAWVRKPSSTIRDGDCSNQE
jgi:hypothetical protein